MLRSFAFAGALLLSQMVPVPALAELATTSGGFVHIRSGPGMNYPAICTAWPGVTFTVTDCGSNWCAVQYLRSNGWISAHHIEVED